MRRGVQAFEATSKQRIGYGEACPRMGKTSPPRGASVEQAEFISAFPLAPLAQKTARTAGMSLAGGDIASSPCEPNRLCAVTVGQPQSIDYETGAGAPPTPKPVAPCASAHLTHSSSLIKGVKNMNIFGSDGIDYLSGTSGDDYISGEEGNDYLAGKDGNDALNGGAGDDTLVGAIIDSNGEDYLTGGVGADTFVLGERGDVYYGEGSGEWANIYDFDFNQGDRLVLAGIDWSNYNSSQQNSEMYIIEQSPRYSTGSVEVDLFFDSNFNGIGEFDETVARITSEAGRLDLNADYILYQNY